jgi:Ca2+-binding EF-hand superfamily protein
MGASLTKEEQAIVDQVCKEPRDDQAIKQAVISWREGKEALNKAVACNEADFLVFVKKSGLWGAFVEDQAEHMASFIERTPVKAQKTKEEWNLEIYQKIMADEDYSKQLAKLWFHAADTDHSGSVDLKEFLTFLLPMTSQDPKVKAALVFQIYDADGDGFINAAELRTILELDRQLFKLSTTLMKEKVIGSFFIRYIEAFRVAGSISFDATLAGNALVHDAAHTDATVKLAFSMFDKNVDDKLSLEEFVKWRVDQQSQWRQQYLALVQEDAKKHMNDFLQQHVPEKSAK